MRHPRVPITHLGTCRVETLDGDAEWQMRQIRVRVSEIVSSRYPAKSLYRKGFSRLYRTSPAVTRTPACTCR